MSFSIALLTRSGWGQAKSAIPSYPTLSLLTVHRDVVLGQINGVDEAVDIFHRVGGVWGLRLNLVVVQLVPQRLLVSTVCQSHQQINIIYLKKLNTFNCFKITSVIAYNIIFTQSQVSNILSWLIVFNWLCLSKDSTSNLQFSIDSAILKWVHCEKQQKWLK